MAEIKIKKGDEVFCVHRKAIDGGETPGMPIKGKIIAITNRLNRQIAVQLDEKIFQGGSCDGRGPEPEIIDGRPFGYCLWCRPWHLLTPAEWESKKKQLEEAAKHAQELDTEVDELVLRNVG
jgi:hypothetical protein